jgi:hypothetical protein
VLGLTGTEDRKRVKADILRIGTIVMLTDTEDRNCVVRLTY